MRMYGSNHQICVEHPQFAVNEQMLRANFDGHCNDRSMMIRLTGVSEKAFYEAIPSKCRWKFLLETPSQRAVDSGTSKTDNSFNLETWQIYVLVVFGFVCTLCCVAVCVGTIIIIERKNRKTTADGKEVEDIDAEGGGKEFAADDGYYDENGNWVYATNDTASPGDTEVGAPAQDAIVNQGDEEATKDPKSTEHVSA